MTTERTTGRRWCACGLAALAAAVVLGSPAGAHADELTARAGEATSVYGPLFVFAVAIERFWETLFTMVEHSTVVFGRVMALLHRPIDDLRATLAAAQARYDAAKQARLGEAANGRAIGAVDAGLRDAEEALEDVRRRAVEVVDDPVYVRFKRRVILYGSPALGLLVAWKGDVALLHAMGLREMPRDLDLVLTGLVIGGGSEPVHGLLSSVRSFQKALGSVSERARSERDATR